MRRLKASDWDRLPDTPVEEVRVDHLLAAIDNREDADILRKELSLLLWFARREGIALGFLGGQHLCQKHKDPKWLPWKYEDEIFELVWRHPERGTAYLFPFLDTFPHVPFIRLPSKRDAYKHCKKWMDVVNEPAYKRKYERWLDYMWIRGLALELEHIAKVWAGLKENKNRRSE